MTEVNFDLTSHREGIDKQIAVGDQPLVEILTVESSTLLPQTNEKARSLCNLSVTNKSSKKSKSMINVNTRSSKRIDSQKVKHDLLEAISLQSKINNTLLEEIKDQLVTCNRLQQITTELTASTANVHDKYNKYRELNLGSEKGVTMLVDKLTHDNNNLIALAEQIISDRSARPKTPHMQTPIEQNLAPPAGSINSQLSSNSSKRTTSSALYKQKQLEAAARATELEAELVSAANNNKIEMEIAKLNNEKRSMQLKKK